MLAGPLRGWVAGRQVGWLGRQNASSAEGGKRRDEPGKEKVKLKHCIALVVIEFARASLRARRALGRLAGARSTEAPPALPYFLSNRNLIPN